MDQEVLIALIQQTRREIEKAGMAVMFNLKLNFFQGWSCPVQAILSRLD
jgi:hypothetical protein